MTTLAKLEAASVTSGCGDRVLCVAMMPPVMLSTGKIADVLLAGIVEGGGRDWLELKGEYKGTSSKSRASVCLSFKVHLGIREGLGKRDGGQ